MDEIFQDMLNKGLVSTGRQLTDLTDLSKMTIHQAIFHYFLSQPNVDYILLLDFDAVDWREWFRIHRN